MPAPTNGLIFFWNLESLSGAQIDDLAGTNKGTITGTVDKPGQIGRCRGFDGVDDKIAATSPPITSQASYTVLFWARPIITGSVLALSMDAVGANYFSYGIIAGNKWTFAQRSSATTVVNTSGPTYATGIWHHIAGRYNGHTGYLFVDGVTQASGANTGTTTWNSFTVGQRVGNLNLYTGDVDELRIYNKSLSLASVIEVYQDTVAYPLRLTKRKSSYLPSIFPNSQVAAKRK